MAYYLGKDVDVYLTTEVGRWGITSGAAGASTAFMASGIAWPANGVIYPMLSGAMSATKLGDVTGIDFSPAKMDEDVSYMGLNTNQKVEVENQYAVTITKKRNSSVFDRLYNGARYGLYVTSGGVVIDEADYLTVGTGVIHDGLTRTKLFGFGYRIYLVLKDADGGEAVTIRNNCLNSHTVTLNADGTQEETMEFYSYVTPVYVSSSADLNTTSTPIAEL